MYKSAKAAAIKNMYWQSVCKCPTFNHNSVLTVRLSTEKNHQLFIILQQSMAFEDFFFFQTKKPVLKILRKNIAFLLANSF